jgi:hypothetical protein
VIEKFYKRLIDNIRRHRFVFVLGKSMVNCIVPYCTDKSWLPNMFESIILYHFPSTFRIESLLLVE